MANKYHLQFLKQGVTAWNQWRQDNPALKPDLRKADLSGVNLSAANLAEAILDQANLSRANLSDACLVKAHLCDANFAGANLAKAKLTSAMLDQANLSGANLTETILLDTSLLRARLIKANLNRALLFGAILTETDFSGADLTGADLRRAQLIETNFENATLVGCSVYGISAWNIELHHAIQSDLIITLPGEPTITVDDIEIAQFINLLLNNQRLRHIIDSITSKVVLILGRFTPERKVILDAIRNGLRHHNYSPVLFDFEKPASRDLTETISLLSHIAKFVVADITDPRSIPQELLRIVPALPSVPVLPLLQASSDEYSMFEHFKRYPWVLDIYCYKDLDDLLKSFEEKVIAPAETKVREIILK